MQNFQLSTFLKISGIGSASGIVYIKHSLYIISDNSGFLYQYHLESKELQKHPLIDNPSENIPKIVKPDFEAITLKGSELHFFGSGSTLNRNLQFVFNTENKQTTTIDLTSLYQKIKDTVSIADEDLNIEGALYYQEHLFLFQRGNGVNSRNGIIKINENGHDNVKIQFQSIQLPKIAQVETSFTDAILVDDLIYFLASAEDTISTYEDGEVLGTIIGAIHIETFEIIFTQQISGTHKFEGLTLCKQSDDTISFLLCEDNDTEELEIIIYQLVITI
jgi:hypothetical protein